MSPQNWWSLPLMTSGNEPLWYWQSVDGAELAPEPVVPEVYRPFDHYPEKWEPKERSRRDCFPD